MKAATYIQDWFSLLALGALVATVPYILSNQVIKVSPEVEAKEFENKAILLANSLMSNQNLIYSDNRAMFDKKNLDTKMIEKSAAKNMATCTSSSLLLCNSLNSYPESFSVVLVKDGESSPPQGWFSILWPKSSALHKKMTSCLSGVDNNEIGQLFVDGADIPKILNLKGCGFNRYSTILNEMGFNIAIRYSNGDVHMGWIKVMVVE